MDIKEIMYGKEMTVRQLIEQLEYLPQDKVVKKAQHDWDDCGDDIYHLSNISKVFYEKDDEFVLLY